MTKKILITILFASLIMNCGKIKKIYDSVMGVAELAKKQVALSGKIVFIKGKLKINGKKAKLDDKVSYGDKLKTSKKSKAAIQVAGKNILMMYAKTKLTYKIKKGDGLLYVPQGALAAVIKNRAAVGEFRIKTPTTTAGVRGTTLFVKSLKKKKRSYTCVCNGKITIKSAKGEKVVEAAHHQAYWYSKKGDKLKIKQVGMVDHDDNTQQQLADLIDLKLTWELKKE